MHTFFAYPWVRYALCLWLPTVGLAQSETITLPAPTGPHGVGTTTWHWIDADRLDARTPDPTDTRAVMVQAWYPAPADTQAAVAAYMPLYAGYAHVLGHSVAGAPMAALAEPAPVLLLTPGRGTTRHFYTALAEDWASHGYIVIGIDSPHSGRVVYPDGLYIPPTSAYQPSRELMMGPYEHVDAFFEEAATLGAGDVALVLRKLEALNQADPARRFTGRLDLNRMGLFGHSLGGRIGGAAVAQTPGIKAYASMEGVPPRPVRYGGMAAAVAMLYSSGLPDVAQPNIRSVIPNRKNDVYLFRLEGFGHNSVTDRPLLDPDNYDYSVDPIEGLAVSRLLTRTFFDRYVRLLPADVAGLDQHPLITAEFYPKPVDP